jgi:hypothetical protein
MAFSTQGWMPDHGHHRRGAGVTYGVNGRKSNDIDVRRYGEQRA